MADVKALHRGDRCPTCGGAFRGVGPDVPEKGGALHRCGGCGYQTRFAPAPPPVVPGSEPEKPARKVKE